MVLGVAKDGLTVTVTVTVSDTAPGIPQDQRDGLFQRPFTLGGARRDGGLGLGIVHRILELHGRAIALVDDAEHGAVFRFSLPLAAHGA